MTRHGLSCMEVKAQNSTILNTSLQKTRTGHVAVARAILLVASAKFTFEFKFMANARSWSAH